VVDRVWTFAAAFTVNLDIFYTREEVDNLIGVESLRAQAAEHLLRSLIDLETERSTAADRYMEQRLTDEINRASVAENQLRADIDSMGYNTLRAANQNTYIEIQYFHGLLDGKVSMTFRPALLTGIRTLSGPGYLRLGLDSILLNGSVPGDPVNITLPVADDNQAGIITNATYRRLQEIGQIIDSMSQGGTFIGSYTTLNDLNNIPEQIWWRAGDWAIVQEHPNPQGVIQVAKFILYGVPGGFTWLFGNWMGGTMPGNFSNLRAGLIRGDASTRGRIQPIEGTDGMAAVVGWAEMDTMVTDIRLRVGIGPDGQFNPAPTGLDRRVHDNRRDIDGLRYDTDTNTDDISSLRNRMGTAEGTIGSHGTRLAAAEGTIGTLGTRMTNAEADLDNKVDRINGNPAHGFVSVNINSQGQVTAGSVEQDWTTITGFDGRAGEMGLS